MAKTFTSLKFIISLSKARAAFFFFRGSKGVDGGVNKIVNFINN